MKKLLIAALAVGLSAPVLAAPTDAQSRQRTQQPGKIKPLEQFETTHQGGFYQGTVTRPVPVTDAAVSESGVNAAVGSGAATGTAGEVAASVPASGGLGLSTPLVGSLTVGAAVGIGAAVVAVGAAVGNHGGGGGHHSSGTTGTTK
ncbi:MAG: hypothetical protein QM805_11825 [Pseudomonas sp.]